MIPLYSRPEMARIWSPKNYFRIQLDIETYACEAQEMLGVVPAGVARQLYERGGFEVERIRDWRSFATRRCVALQGDRRIFSLSASFHAEERGLEHALPMPHVPRPEDLAKIQDIAAQLSSRLGNTVDARDLLELAFADVASPDTRRTIERAESRQQALALLLMSPEFQRR